MNVTVLVLFGAIVALTLLITYWAARRNDSAMDHYVANREIKGWQNGLAIAGDYISGASLLGSTGIIALAGFGGIYYGLAVPIAYVLVLLTLAEPMRNLGKYTVGDVITSRFNRRDVRGLTALNTITISLVYMVTQFVGAGALVGLLLGIDFTAAVILMAILLTIYTAWGGMLATTWIQIAQMILLAFGFVLLLVLTLAQFGFNPVSLLREAVSAYGTGVINPPREGLTGSIDTISLNLGLALGVLGLPHIMIRFLTVPDTRTARSSAITATWFFLAFYGLLPILGYGGLVLVGREAITAANPGGNLTITQLADILGGNVLLAFIAAVTLIAIMASLAGITIAASGAFGHDLYTNVWRRGRASDRDQHRAARLASIFFAAVALLISLGAREFNTAFLANLAFAIAASANLPTLLLAVFWKRFNLAGAISGMSVGLAVSVGLVLISPSVMGDSAIFPFTIPALVSVPVGFAAAYIGTLFGGRSTQDEERFKDISVLANVGGERRKSKV